MGNCNCCEDEPSTMDPHPHSNPAPSNPNYPHPYPYPNTGYPSAPPPSIYPPPPPSIYPPPPPETIYPPLPPEIQPYSPPTAAEPSYYWSASSFGGIPPMAVKAGTDKSGESIYVGRAFHNGDTLPAKIVPSHQCAYVAHSGAEHRKEHYDVLCAQESSWHSGRHGEVPDNAVTCGQTVDGETLFVGRVFHDGTLTPGKIHPSHGSIYIPYDGQELSFQEYEVLVIH